VLRTIAISAGATLAGFGVRHLFQLEDGAGNEDDAAAIDAIWDDPSSGNEDSRLQFSLRIGGAALAEVCRLDETGAVLPSGFDVYPEGDDGGLFQRAPNAWMTPTDHFNAFAGFGWAVDAPFDGAPTVATVATYPSLLRIENNDITEDHFAFKATALTYIELWARLAKGAGSYVGIRVDDGDDNDFAEMRLIDSAAFPGMYRVQLRYRVGGAAVTTVNVSDPLPPAFQMFRLIWLDASNAAYFYAATDIPIPIFLGAGAGLTWTAARYGIIFSQRIGVGPDRSGLVDWYYYAGS